MKIEPITGPLPAPTSDKPANLREAAESFEALFIGQMLKIARESGEGGGLGESDQAGATMMEVAEEHFAREMTKNGGIGFARLIMTQLGRAAQAVNDSERDNRSGSSTGPEG